MSCQISIRFTNDSSQGKQVDRVQFPRASKRKWCTPIQWGLMSELSRVTCKPSFGQHCKTIQRRYDVFSNPVESGLLFYDITFAWRKQQKTCTWNTCQINEESTREKTKINLNTLGKELPLDQHIGTDTSRLTCNVMRKLTSIHTSYRRGQRNNSN